MFSGNSLIPEKRKGSPRMLNAKTKSNYNEKKKIHKKRNRRRRTHEPVF